MIKLKLLEQYEPVLRFAKSERFFPMAVEPYVERCSIFASGPQGVLELFADLDKPLIKRIGRLKSGQFYLRFVNKPLNDSDVWVWWAVLSVAGVAAGWFFAGMAAMETAFALSLIAALFIFMVASPVRLRIIPAALAAIFFIALEIAPIWFFLHRSPYVSIAVEYFVLLPIYLIVLFYLSVRTMKFILDHVIPEGPGMVMEILSQATEKIAQESYFEYAKILEKDPQPVYYGRILHETDREANHWTILQYHFFYAFNDWRFAANGMNHHEGDWEMVAVYLKNDEPYAVSFSQHGMGNIEKWEMVRRAVDKQGNETTHPVVYVALGSHANYSRPAVIRSPHMYKPGKLQRLIFWVDGLIQYIFLLLNPSHRARQIALREIVVNGTHFLNQDALNDLRDEDDHYVVSLPMELATGDGFRIGYQGNSLREGVVRSSSYLKRSISDRRTTRPRIKEWRCVLLNSKLDWLQYRGLWGVKSLLKDESGPPGPKWDKPGKNQAGVNKRKRWARPLDWLAELENIRNKK